MSFFDSCSNFFLRALLYLGFTHREKFRQKYHIGWLAPERTLEDLKLHLHGQWGFGNHFVAWTDKGQVLSWRKLTDSSQYHLRVFEDGEIRGHYEYTPEGHPLAHLRNKGEKNMEEDFLKFLGDFVVSQKYVSKLEIDPDAYNPNSEMITTNAPQ
ncbi:MAG: hypothetical protein Q8O46_03315 [bacterium]|nr:hypothetical protein [bacterium]